MMSATVSRPARWAFEPGRVGSAEFTERQVRRPPSAVLDAATFSLGFARSHAGNHSEAEGHFREALKWQAEANAKHWTAAKYKAWLGFALHDQKKYADAEPVLTEAYAEWVKQLSTVPTYERCHPLLLARRLAGLYVATGKPAEAAKWKALSQNK